MVSLSPSCFTVCFCSRARTRYSPIFVSLSFIFNLRSAWNSKILLITTVFLSIVTSSGLLGWDLGICIYLKKSQRILHVSFSRTKVVSYIYYFVVWSNFSLLWISVSFPSAHIASIPRNSTLFKLIFGLIWFGLVWFSFFF